MLLDVFDYKAPLEALGDASGGGCVYLPALESTAGLSSQRNADVNGRLLAYVREPRFDLIVTVSPLDIRLFIDLEGSYVMRT